MPTMITGVRGTGNIQSAKRVIDMANEIALLEPDAAPLTVLLKRVEGKSREAINPEFKWMEDELNPRWDAVNYGTGYTAGATSVVVDNGSYFKVGDVVKAPSSGEQLLVTAVSTNTLTVSRGWGSTSANTLADNAVLLIVGNASEEGSTSPTRKTTQEAVVTNYCQIFKTPFEVTNTNDASEMYGGKDLSYLRKKAGIEHKKSMELAFLFGEAKEDTSGTHYRRATKGINSFVSTNRTDMGGTMTESEFEAFCRTVFRYGKSTKVLLASPIVVSAVNTWAGSKLQMVPKDETYGISVKRYLTGHGELMIVMHKLLEQSYAGYGFAIDMDNVAYRPLKGRDTKLETEIQANDSDTKAEQYITEAGLEFKTEKASGMMYNVTSIG